MRPIKFRGKCCHSDAWAYGNLVDYGEDEYPEIQGFDVFRENDDVWKEPIVERDTIGQFTGLYDKNGEEVYEGDILLWKRKNVHIEGCPLRDFADRCEIFYDDDVCALRFRCKLDCGSCIGLLDFSDDRADESYIEIIGNIHDNPELMRGGGDESK